VSYQPKPIDTERIALSEELCKLTELLAENTHDLWSARRLADGWKWGKELDGAALTHPGIVPYEDLPESEKEYDRTTAMEALKVIVALGYEIRRKEPG